MNSIDPFSNALESDGSKGARGSHERTPGVRITCRWPARSALRAECRSRTMRWRAYFTARAAEGSLDWNQFDERTNEFLKDKLIALDRVKAEFCYHVCRALRARRVVEAGTSFGVSTLFLAAAVRDNLSPGARRASPAPAIPAS